MARPPRAERWLLELAEELRYLAVMEQTRGVNDRILLACQNRGLEPWELTRRIARIWLEQGHIRSLNPAENRA
jgi:hypothetical protein